MKQRFLLTLLLALATTVVFAQGPNNSGTYYKVANGTKGKDLKTAMHNIIKSPNVKSYKGLWDVYKTTDKRSDGYLWDMYSSVTNYVIGGSKQGANYSGEGDSYNREHSVPQSWFDQASPMVSDAHHVVPTDGWVNNQRGNYPFGEVNKNAIDYSSINSFSIRGISRTPGYSGVVFEPNDEYKGDFARIYFYMATCYEGQCENWGGEVFGTKDKYKPLVAWQLDMLMRWAKNDPVSTKEINRNNAVKAVQNNRNPFVDYPGLEEYIWGSKVDEPFSYDNYVQPDGTVTPTDPTDPTEDPNDGTNFPYSEPFSTGQGEFTINNVSLGGDLSYVWKHDATNKYMKASAYKGANIAAESWLISPVIDMSKAETATLAFDQCRNKFFGTISDEATLWIKEEGGSWKQITITYPDLKTNSNWSNFATQTIDLNSYVGKKVQIGFKYVSTNAAAGTWEIRNFSVTGKISTSIDKYTSTVAGKNYMYNLSGQRVDSNYKGIVIKNGKKIIIR